MQQRTFCFYLDSRTGFFTFGLLKGSHGKVRGLCQKQGCRGLQHCPESSKETSARTKMNRKLALVTVVESLWTGFRYEFVIAASATISFYKIE